MQIYPVSMFKHLGCEHCVDPEETVVADLHLTDVLTVHGGRNDGSCLQYLPVQPSENMQEHGLVTMTPEAHVRILSYVPEGMITKVVWGIELDSGESVREDHL